VQPAPTAVQPAPTPAPTTPAVAPTAAPAPTLTVRQAIDRIVSGEKPVETLVMLFEQRPLLQIIGLLLLCLVLFGVYELFKRWTKRGIDAADRVTGGVRHDIKGEVLREEEKEQIKTQRAADRAEQQARTAREQYLDRLQADIARLAKIPALGREQHELALEDVYVPLYVVERGQMEEFARYSLGEFGDEDEVRARSGAYEAVQESRPVFRLLSEPGELPPPSEPDDETEPLERRLGRSRLRTGAPMREETTERLLLVGRAGSGKTTTLHYGALILARAARANRCDEARERLELFARTCPFPVYARLTELMTWVREHHAQQRDELVRAPAQLLLDALDELARRDVPALPSGALAGWIRAGGCLMMLDGLDETGDADERGWAMDWITNLARDCPNNRYLVASRPFEGLGERLPGFIERHLRPLDADDIRRLLNRLFKALRLQDDGPAAPDGDPDALVPEAAELWRNLERSPRLFDMATNPLLLTSMAVLVEGREPLPVERAKIYEKLVRLTIEAWRKAQLTRDRPGVPVKLFDESDDSVRLRLQLLARDMLEQQRRELTLEQARDLLRPVYRNNYPDWNEERCNDYVRNLLYRLALHSGLLQARDADSLFSFTHFTLQEYLAARDYTEQRSDKPANVAALVARWPERRWRETILLAIGHEATSGSRESARGLLQALLDAGDPEALLLAGDALDEANARTVGELTRQRLAVCERLRALAALSDDWRTAAHPDPVLRNRAATLLDRLDADSERPGLDLFAPEYWAARIAPGTFSMGDDNGPYDAEKPQFDYTIRRPYVLARFPVTNRQYGMFLDWLRANPDGQARYGAPDERRPRYWPGERWRAGEGNHPVVGVSWYDATAFAAWAERMLRERGLLPAGEEVRLPTEPEWERAAAYPVALPPGNPRAGRREYPWGDWDDPHPGASRLPSPARGRGAGGEGILGIQANIDKSRIGGTSVVGIFPHGVAACGAQDMAGNVLEWCSTLRLQYPFKGEVSEVSAETLYIQRERSMYVLRGGSWSNYRDHARCAYRDAPLPVNVNGNNLFRLARLFSSSSS
jgi:formylglycine-generating enzyme required for sulfatase activity/plasmid stabilization system protein ParE/energy-coupling factor transporter ATP-binding protein EcfA2